MLSTLCWPVIDNYQLPAQRMQDHRMVESHIVQAKNSTPVKVHFIELSPKKKSKPSLHPSSSTPKIQPQSSASIIDSHNTYKENNPNPVNFQIVNIPIRTEKPFQKIPTFKNQQVIVRTKTMSALDHSESKSKRKKITVTKMLSEYPKSQIQQTSAFNVNRFEENVASQEF